MPPLFRHLVLVSDDSSFIAAVSVMAEDRGIAERVTTIPPADLPDAGCLETADGILVDADTCEDAAVTVATLSLMATAPIFALGLRLPPDAAIVETLTRIGARGCFVKESGAAAPGLAGAEGARLAQALRGALSPRGSQHG